MNPNNDIISFTDALGNYWEFRVTKSLGEFRYEAEEIRFDLNPFYEAVAEDNGESFIALPDWGRKLLQRSARRPITKRSRLLNSHNVKVDRVLAYACNRCGTPIRPDSKAAQHVTYLNLFLSLTNIPPEHLLSSETLCKECFLIGRSKSLLSECEATHEHVEVVLSSMLFQLDNLGAIAYCDMTVDDLAPNRASWEQALMA